jgi:hypothetical protein
MAASTFFFYLEHKVEVHQETLNGAQIKAAIKAEVPDFDLTHELVLEGEVTGEPLRAEARHASLPLSRAAA